MFLSLTRLGWLVAIGVWFSGLGTLWFSSDEIETHRATFQQLDSDAQREMLRKWERFQTLSSVEKKRLVEFDQQLAAHPDTEHLLSLINQYYEWNLALSDRERADLAVASSDLRIERIQKFRMAQYASNLGRDESTRLSIEDLVLFWEWWRERMRGNSEERGERRPIMRSGQLALSEEELDDLQGKFSEKAASLMRQSAGKLSDGRDGRNELVQKWAWASFRPSTATLKSFYETLDENERAELLETADMTPEAINSILIQKYAQRIGIPSPGGRGRQPGGPNTGGPNSGGPGRGPGGPGGPSRGPGGPGGPGSNQRPADERSPNPDPGARTQAQAQENADE